MAGKIQLLAIILAISISVGYARRAKKIINGQTASMGGFPHQVSLQTEYEQHICGGCIITSTLILTAAHCIIDEKKGSYINDIYAVVGTNNIKERTSETLFRVIRRIINDFHPSNSFHDIAILKLDRPIHPNKSNSVGVAVLGTYNLPAGTRVMSSGWGATEYYTWAGQSGNFPQFLKKLERVVVSQEMCQYALRRSSKIGPGQICVWSPNKAALCVGDSGGPLTYDGMVIGIASFVIPCAKGYPDVYTRVSYYTDWIFKVTEIMNNNWTVPYNNPLIVEV